MSTNTSDKVARTLEIVERVNRTLDEKQGSVASAARRERQRTLERYGRALSRAAMVVLAVSVITIIIGLIKPIGMIGFLAAVALAAGIAALIFFHDVFGEAKASIVPKDATNGEMVQRFDSYLFQSRRALPRPAQEVVDDISAHLATLKATLERVDPLDPDAQDARRLMSVHLPGLVERYANVPPAYRSQPDAEGKTVDERLIEGLGAARSALNEVSDRLARRDMDAFQTQGRFIQSKYGEPESPA